MRRGRRGGPFNPFARDASEQHRRRREERTGLAQARITQNLNREPAVEMTTRVGSRERRKPYIHKQLKSPRSPKISVKRNPFLEAQTEKTRDFVKDVRNSKSIKTDSIQIDLSDIEDILEKMNEEIDEEINRNLRNEIEKNEGRLNQLMEKYGIDPKDWSAISKNDIVAELYRRIHVIEYEMYKHENNGFLKSFDIESLPSNHLKALCALNGELSKIKSARHVGNGKIFLFRNGVRVVLDSRKTVLDSLDGKKKVWAFVGPNHNEVCLNSSSNIGGDSIWTILLIHRANWPKELLMNMDGVGRLSIKYQFEKWEHPNYNEYENLIHQYYDNQAIMIHSIEIYPSKSLIIISPSADDLIGKLIGRNGVHPKKIEQLIGEKSGQEWLIRIESLV